MNNNKYLQYALRGSKDVIHKLAGDIKDLKEERIDIINKNRQLVNMVTYYKELAEEQKVLHQEVENSYKKEIEILKNRLMRKSVRKVKLSLVEKIRINTERNKRTERTVLFLPLI